jgi:hypothetical protein
MQRWLCAYGCYDPAEETLSSSVTAAVPALVLLSRQHLYQDGTGWKRRH